MLAPYRKKSNIAAAVWLCTLVGLALVMPSAKGNIWDQGDLPQIGIMLLSIASFWYAFWAFAKAKGYSGLLGLVLPMFSVIGLVVLLLLRDKHPENI